MLAVAALTLAISTAATTLGPVLSGVIGTYPVAITIVITFTHSQFSRNAALTMLRCIVVSWISFASCFLAIGLGALAAVATSVFVLWMDRFVRRKETSELVRKS